MTLFQAAMTELRSKNGINATYPWANPLKWSSMNSFIQTVSQTIYGSYEYVLDMLNTLGIKPLLTIHFGNFETFL
jgi:hypothetical protein